MSVADKPLLACLLPGIFPEFHWLMASQRADSVVILDNALWSRKSRVHRGLIRTSNGTSWVYVPIHAEDREKPLAQARISPEPDWFRHLEKSIITAYKNSIYFDDLGPELLDDLGRWRDFSGFVAFSDWFLRRWMGWLGLKTSWSRATEYFPDLNTPAAVGRQLGYSQIVVERRSEQYVMPLPGEPQIIFEETPYRQHFGGFVQGTCFLDRLFELGPEAGRAFMAKP